MRKVIVEDMLAARDRRVDIQNRMLEEGGSDCSLACLTMNIAGEIKRTPMTKMLFDRGISEFEQAGFEVIDHMLIDEFTGSEAFWLVKENGAEVKKYLEDVEDSFPAARLFDFDVLTPDGVKLSRAKSRKCLICDKPAAECARSRAHGLDTIKAATQALLRDFCAEALAEEAHDALLAEVYSTPKPGLVDLANNGAHKDMDVDLFEKSADALMPYFYDAAALGMRGCTMAELRERGLAAEQEMYAATGGVNTHKGMIYSMGLLLAGMGMALAGKDINGQDRLVIKEAPGDKTNNIYGIYGVDAETKQVDIEKDVSGEGSKKGLLKATGEGSRQEAIRNAAGLASEDAERMLARARSNPDTNGAAVLRDYGALGATGHAASGFPGAVFTTARLEYYIKEEKLPGGEAGALALCDSMASLEDTNLLHRGGAEGLAFTKEKASTISGLPISDRIDALTELDNEMIERNLSPGGSADMLALAFLLYKWN